MLQSEFALQLEKITRIRRAMKRVNARIDALRERAERCTANWGGAYCTGGTPSDRVAEYSCEIADEETKLRSLRRALMGEMGAVYDAITAEGFDADAAMAIKLHDLRGLPWARVAEEMHLPDAQAAKDVARRGIEALPSM